MAQRSVEILIGRLLTDESFRNAFLKNGSRALEGFRETGHELTELEIAAVLATPPDLWSAGADEIDPRLQKVNLSIRVKE